MNEPSDLRERVRVVLREEYGGTGPDDNSEELVLSRILALFAPLQFNSEIVSLLSGNMEKTIGELFSENRKLKREVEELKTYQLKVHLRHCVQGEYETSCKYGEDEECPALLKKSLAEAKTLIIKWGNRGFREDEAKQFLENNK